MPDPIVTPKEGTGFPDAEKHNKEIAAKLAAQDIMGQSTAPDPNADSGSELDKLAKQAEEAHKNPPEVDPKPEPKPELTDEEKAKAAEETAKAAEEARKAEEERQAVQKRADEYFKDSPALPPNASPKSSEAFSAIKIKAAQDIAARDAQIEKLAKDKAELEQRLQKQTEVPPDAVKELEEHRQWRAKLDVEADPKFKEYDRKIASASEFVYAQLLQSPAINQTVIDEIKKHGGPDKVKLDKVFEAINDPTLQRIVEAKQADIAVARYEKAKAIEAAKENIAAYIKEREQTFSQQAVQHVQATNQHLSRTLGGLDWFVIKEVPKDADADTKKAIEADNAFVAETRDQIAEALKDGSAEMRAVMLTGMAQLFKLQRDLPAITKERDALKEQVKELEGKLAAIKNASRARIRESGAAPGASAKVTKSSDQFNVPATDALDSIMKEIQEKRAAQA